MKGLSNSITFVPNMSNITVWMHVQAAGATVPEQGQLHSRTCRCTPCWRLPEAHRRWCVCGHLQRCARALMMAFPVRMLLYI